MNIDPSDKILATVKQFSQGRIYGTTKGWDNISEMVISCENPNKEIVPAQELPTEVDRIDGDTAYVNVTRAPYIRYVWPGDTVEITPTHFSEDGLAVAEHSTPSFDVVHVIGAVPDETVVVKILKITENIAIGKAIETCSPGLEIGDTLEATVEAGTSVGKTERGAFEIQLGTEADIRAKVIVKITNLDGQVEAEIVDPGVLPIPDNELTASVERNLSVAYVSKGDYEIELSEPALATGSVKVRVNQAEEDKLPKASIVSYNGLLPDVGETVAVWSIEGEAKAKPEKGSYRISLPAKIPVHTRFTVEITDRQGKVRGKLSDVGSLPVSGNQVKAEIEKESTSAVVEVGQYQVSLSSPALASGVVTIEIDSPPKKRLAEAHIASYDGLLPAVGERVKARSKSGKSVAEPNTGTYTLCLDEATPIVTSIIVEVDKIDKKGVHCSIVDQGEIPNVNDRVEARVFFKRDHAKADSGYQVKLDNKSIVTGAATIRIDEVGEKNIRGSILDHHSLPDVGDTVHGKVKPGKQIAEATSRRYEIDLEDHTTYDGMAVIEITDIDETVHGKIIRKNSRRAYKKRPFENNNLKNDLISQGSR